MGGGGVVSSSLKYTCFISRFIMIILILLFVCFSCWSVSVHLGFLVAKRKQKLMRLPSASSGSAGL